MMIPRIHIQYSPYLDEIYKAWIWADPRYKDWVCPSLKRVKNKARLFSRTWDKIGPKILRGICQNTGLVFKRNYFPIYIVSGNTRTYSNPIVLKSGYSEKEFVDMVTHELIHCLFVDNKESRFVYNVDKYNDHVVLYAVMESVLQGSVNQEIDVKKFPQNSNYLQAMLYVKTNGYKGILKKCKSI